MKAPRPIAAARPASRRLPPGVGALAAILAALAAGCATPDPAGSFAPVRQAVQQHTGADLVWARDDEARTALDARVARMLAEPLDAATAVQLALLNHRGLQARLADLGLADAERAMASSLANPGFGFGRTRAGDEREIERSLHLNLARWLLTPWTAEAATRQVDLTRRQVILAVLDHAAQTRQAWVRAVAAAQSVQYQAQVMQAAEASAELARRMQQVGNFNALQRAREQAFYADAALNLARAEQAARSTRERLTRLLGLWGAQTAYRLPDRLPELPAQWTVTATTPQEAAEIERTGLARRLDVQAAQHTLEAQARHLGLTRSTRLISVVELGLSHNSPGDGPSQRGWEVSVELPIFDAGQGRVARAEHAWRQSVDRAAALAIDARSEIREAYAQARSAWEIARHHRDEIVPLRARIAEENLLRYNGMLIGVFELLADARVQIASVNAAIEAERDFWLAESDLQAALTGPLPGRTAAAGAGGSAPAPAATGDGH